jgi:ATP-binding cassette subfamily B protein
LDARLTTLIAALETHRPSTQPERTSGESNVPSLQQALRSRETIASGLALLAAHALYTALTIAAWVLVGAGALSGRIDRGWLVAWALCLASAAVARAAGIWLQGTMAIRIGGVLRQRLLAGAMATDPDVIHRRGSAELLSDVLETETLERLAIGGAFDTLLPLVEILIAAIVLVWGATPAFQIPVLVGWTVLAGCMLLRNTRLRQRWTIDRLAVTEESIEGMLAHRTRVVQQPPGAWHAEEDRLLEQYIDRSHAIDRSTAVFEALLPRGYVVAALLALAPALLSGTATLVQQAVTLGVVLHVSRSLRRLTFGAGRAAAAGIAWRRVERIAETGPPAYRGSARIAFAAGDSRLLQVDDVSFSHDGRPGAAVRNCALTMRRGDFVLVEGDSGCGKSTLASLIAGRRRPSSGAILSCGLDPQTAGVRGWRRHITGVPQYHENHVLSASLAFNLLLGRPTPHSSADLEEARRVCLELGLGPLLERMPSGLEQMVGETGWQLSHGERSRVFLARALLQRPALVILDETFAALDPESLRQSIDCVFRRVESALVIAHP